ncbi:GH32 C-terminal domain-containing protein [Flavobacterium aquiphilum]|uniref:GH32 C-terminal domain-containing protein n=1 Tax=Flavobacterium aquiphilum TaxID=3003261 RepID=UPI0024804B61|nr:GH32 C-terminal domain-containing protein [Flavobacterium aquiphilum]
MKKKYLLVGLLLIGCKSQKDPTPDLPDTTPQPNVAAKIIDFGFDESSGQNTVEIVSKSSFTINGPIDSAERIRGLEGNALRVNGYYGWASGNATVNYPSKSVSISGWIAPAVFPVQRKNEDAITENTVAAIFSNQNTTNSSGISFGINQHGKIIAQFKVGNNVKEIISDEEVKLREWSFIVLNIDAEKGVAKLFLNGVEVETISFPVGNLGWDKSMPILIGKESKSKTVAGFDTNGLTGAIDLVSVWNKALTADEILLNFKSQKVIIPDLSIPESRFANDFHKPKYHLMPSAGWTNESHGLIYLDGKYHIFSQRNINGPYLEQINWGHYVSDDLVNWTEIKQALWPQPGFDEVGIWSGHAVVTNGKPYLFYTGVNKSKAGIGLAQAESPYIEWKKNPDPIVASAPPSVPNADFRDPFVFNENGTWYMMIGTGLRSGVARGGLFLYRSSNDQFNQWTYDGIMLEGNPVLDGTGDFWEMPVYHNFGSKSIVLINKLPNANSLYWTGSFSNGKFIKDNAIPERLDVINQLLSPTIQEDKDGNLVAIGIIPDGVTSQKEKEQGWAHMLSLPRVWTLVNNKIYQKPHPSLVSLRKGSQNFSNVSFSSGVSNVLNGARGTQYEIQGTINPGDASKVGFILNKGTANGEETLIYYDYVAQNFVVNRSNSSKLSGVPLSNLATSYPLAKTDINWHIFVDASSIEVFINDQLAFATRVFPSKGSDLIELYAQGGTAIVKDLTIYNIEGSGTVSSKKISQKSTVIEPIVYPNPSASEFNIQFNNVASKTVVYAGVIDINGNIVRKIITMTNPESKIQWDGFYDNGQKADRGVYIIRGIINNEIFQTKVIVK